MFRRARDAWLHSRIGTRRHVARKHQSANHSGPFRRRLQFEPLEERRVLSTITVNTLVDENNGIGVGGVSLRDAIAAAIPSDTIDFSVTGTISLTNGQLLINKSLTIQGPGAGLLAIRQSPPFPPGGNRVLAVADGTASLIDVELSGLAITGGWVFGMGGALGAGIINNENLTLRSCIVSGNRAGQGSFNNGDGAGIFSSAGTLTVIDSTISGNDSDGNAGGIRATSGNLVVTNSTISNNRCVYSGGGIFANCPATISGSTISDNVGGANFTGGGIAADSTALVTVTNSTIRNNSARSGGGIYRGNGSLNVTGSTIDDNDAVNGAGIYADSTAVTVSDSLISGNTATSIGGGIYGLNGQLIVTGSTLSGNRASYGGGLLGRSNTMTIERTTISGNQSPHSNGGGIESVFATLNVFSSTISGNTSGAGGGILSYFSTSTVNHSTITGNYGSYAGGGINVTGGTLSLSHTIVAGNTGDGPVRDDISGPVSATYSFIGDNTGAVITDNGGNQIGSGTSPIDPLLAPLADNSGLTMTHALLAGSTAIDAGDPAAVAGVGGVPEFDQRGGPFTRVFEGNGVGGARIDIGAFEVQSAAPSLPGDYNLDDIVDAADYVVWRKTLGTSVAPPFAGADGDGDSSIDPGDYDVWYENFGEELQELGSGGNQVANFHVIEQINASTPVTGISDAEQGKLSVAVVPHLSTYRLAATTERPSFTDPKSNASRGDLLIRLLMSRAFDPEQQSAPDNVEQVSIQSSDSIDEDAVDDLDAVFHALSLAGE